MFKLIVAGGRDFDNYPMLEDSINDLYSGQDIEIVSGCARGADELGIRYAHENNLPLKGFPADWGSKGKGAGYLRNEEMAIYADGLIAFWDGQSRGTAHMIKTAKSAGLEVTVVKYRRKHD